ncbi:MAG: hypothetical protein EBR82_33320 [Caulobacteraceae bacterium]|nr:hypothetical protein [Caulobacteraceae bacterium]
MKTLTKTGTLINTALPEGVDNPAVGGVFVLKDDPAAWYTITAVGKVRGVTTGLRTLNGTGTRTAQGLAYYEAREGRDEVYNYLPAGTPAAVKILAAYDEAWA